MKQLTATSSARLHQKSNQPTAKELKMTHSTKTESGTVYHPDKSYKSNNWGRIEDNQSENQDGEGN